MADGWIGFMGAARWQGYGLLVSVFRFLTGADAWWQRASVLKSWKLFNGFLQQELRNRDCKIESQNSKDQSCIRDVQSDRYKLQVSKASIFSLTSQSFFFLFCWSRTIVLPWKSIYIQSLSFVDKFPFTISTYVLFIDVGKLSKGKRKIDQYRLAWINHEPRP